MKKFNSIFPENLKKKFRILRSIFGEIFYKFPTRDLKIIAVTGTSGKSTTANMIFHILKQNGLKTGVISTVGAMVDNKTIDTGFHVTTPDPFALQKYLAFMKKRGAEYVVIECSSHALAQGRLGRLKFDIGVFTNIKRDHIDWHGNWENYASAKGTILDRLKIFGKVVINRDDKDMYNFLVAKSSKDTSEYFISYSIKEPTNIIETAAGTRFTLNNVDFFLPIIGTYNIENALAAINTALSLGLEMDQIAKGLNSFMGIEGRMQVMLETPFQVIVDFAHNADSLEKSLEAAKKICAYNGKLITVFGSAGLRDVEKRFEMGRVCGLISDITIITAEDPRTESLKLINDKIIEGAMTKAKKIVHRFLSHAAYMQFLEENKNLEFEKGDIYVFDEEKIDARIDAIDLAIRFAKPGDVVITQGKGHEQSLCFGTTEYQFSDQETIKNILSKYNNGAYKDQNN
jgi:UDP-N-acetylmuramoyl-L-alanyl-D-glutamate--2,6-diaminopimelate ligase